MPYKFSGKERDEETGLSYFGARYYDAGVAVWYGVDPLAEKYPNVGGYVHVLGNPIRYIDPDGNEPKPVRSRIQYSGNGRFNVNLNNLNRATRNNYYMASENMKNWTYNSKTRQDDIGISTDIAQMRIQHNPITLNPNYTPPNMDNTLGAPNPAHNPASVTTVAENAKSTGQPDRRVKPTTINSGTAATKGGASFMLALSGFFVAYDLWSAYSVNQDLNAINKQKGSLQAAFNAVADLASRIPLQYRNDNDLGAITNFVFQGVNNTGNQDITAIGTNILIEKGRYDSNTQQVKPYIEE